MNDKFKDFLKKKFNIGGVIVKNMKVRIYLDDPKQLKALKDYLKLVDNLLTFDSEERIKDIILLTYKMIKK